MDIVTHGLLGALAAQSVSSSRHLRTATFIGFLTALLPDLDVFIRSNDDVLMALTYHRHFTHALVFVPLGALIASLLLYPFLHQKLSRLQMYGFAFSAYLSACLLDACTSYGTHLFWPLIQTPVALSIIAVVDPLFTLLVLIALIAAFRHNSSSWGKVGILLALSYLALAGLQHQRAHTAALTLALERGLLPERIMIKPTLGNLLLWRALTLDGQMAYADAIRVGLPGSVKIYPGESTSLINPLSWGDLPESSPAYEDLQRYYQLADKVLVAAANDGTFIGDGRYSMLPTRVMPIWGIRLSPENPDKAAGFVVEREFSPEMRKELIDMLKGK